MLQFIRKGLEKVAIQQKCLQAIRRGEGRVKKVSDLLNHISFLQTHRSAVRVTYNIQKGSRKKNVNE